MKRYDFFAYCGCPDNDINYEYIEHLYGDWVKYEDVEELSKIYEAVIEDQKNTFIGSRKYWENRLIDLQHTFDTTYDMLLGYRDALSKISEMYSGDGDTVSMARTIACKVLKKEKV